MGFDNDLVTSDNDIIVGITDGSISNQFYISDPSTNSVCGPSSNAGGTHEGNTASEGSLYYPGQVTLLLQPFFKYGACYTAHDGGFVNVARFNSELDPTKGLSLVVQRDNEAVEQYRIYYFIVEIL